MESYIRYFKNILSFIVKPIIDKEYLLPISNTEDSVKCKDFDMDNDNWIGIRKYNHLPYNYHYQSYNDFV
jgi:hypothetical protein